MTKDYNLERIHVMFLNCKDLASEHVIVRMLRSRDSPAPDNDIKRAQIKRLPRWLHLGSQICELEALCIYGLPNQIWVAKVLLLYQGSQEMVSNRPSGKARISEKLVSVPLTS